jgi:hypothetical protein
VTAAFTFGARICRRMDRVSRGRSRGEKRGRGFGPAHDVCILLHRFDGLQIRRVRPVEARNESLGIWTAARRPKLECWSLEAVQALPIVHKYFRPVTCRDRPELDTDLRRYGNAGGTLALHVARERPLRGQLRVVQSSLRFVPPGACFLPSSTSKTSLPARNLASGLEGDPTRLLRVAC